MLELWWYLKESWTQELWSMMNAILMRILQELLISERCHIWSRHLKFRPYLKRAPGSEAIEMHKASCARTSLWCARTSSVHRASEGCFEECLNEPFGSSNEHVMPVNIGCWFKFVSFARIVYYAFNLCLNYAILITCWNPCK